MTRGGKTRRISGGTRPELSSSPLLGGDELRSQSISCGEGWIKSSAAAPNYGQLQIMASRKCHNNHALISRSGVCISLGH